MRSSSIFHFFTRLVFRRAYFPSVVHLRDFPFPRPMIAAESSNHFPNFVLKAYQDGEVSGGEFVELLDSTSYEIPSFGSVPPTATKPISGLPDDVIENIQVVDEVETCDDYFESPDPLPIRDVYYLLRGLRKTVERPIYKVVLVSGAFFDTLATDKVLTSAVSQIVDEASHVQTPTQSATENRAVQQSDLESLRQIEDASISVRFEPEFNAVADVNLLCKDRFPMITEDTMTLLVQEDGVPPNTGTTEQYRWHDAPSLINTTHSFLRLKGAYAASSPGLSWLTKVSILRHPISGIFFMARVTLQTPSIDDPESCPCKFGERS